MGRQMWEKFDKDCEEGWPGREMKGSSTSDWVVANVTLGLGQEWRYGSEGGHCTPAGGSEVSWNSRLLEAP